jgi:hypothetical protein
LGKIFRVAFRSFFQLLWSVRVTYNGSLRTWTPVLGHFEPVFASGDIIREVQDCSRHDMS